MQRVRQSFRDFNGKSFEVRKLVAKNSYNSLCTHFDSYDVLDLLCVICGANGGVSEIDYKLMIELTHDRGSKAMFVSLVNSMYTPYTIQRVCKKFSRDLDSKNWACLLVFAFASLKGYLSSDDEVMLEYIYGLR